MMERQLGRESQKDNDLFYTCSLIDYIARKTKNKRVAVVDALGKERIAKIYDLADIYHSDNIERVSEVYHSFISDKIDDYNSSVYYENPSYIFECFIQNKIL